MQFTIKLNGVKEALEKFDPAKVRRAAKVSLNRAVKSGRTEASSVIRERWNIKKSDLDRKITFKGALMSNLTAMLTVEGEPINLLYFGARQITGGRSISLKRKGSISVDAQFKTGRAGRGYSGVTVRIKRGRKTVLPKAFMGRGKGGTPLVFIRSSKVKSTVKGKEGLKAVKVITKASIFKQAKTLDKVVKKIERQWQKEWDNQIKQFNSGKGWMERE